MRLADHGIVARRSGQQGDEMIVDRARGRLGILDRAQGLSQRSERGEGRMRGAVAEAVGERFCRNRHIAGPRSEEHTSELQSLMRLSYSVLCFNKNNERKQPL